MALATAMSLTRRLRSRCVTPRRLVEFVCLASVCSFLLLLSCHINDTNYWLHPRFCSIRSKEKSNDVSVDGNLPNLMWKSLVKYNADPRERTKTVHDVLMKQEKMPIVFIVDDSKENNPNRGETNWSVVRMREMKFVGDRVSSNNSDKPLVKLQSPKQQFKAYGKPENDRTSVQFKTQKVILLWTTFFGKSNWLPGENFQNCSVPGWSGNIPACRVTSSKADLNVSDLIIFHGNDLTSSSELPASRSPNQSWMFYCQESPEHMYLNLDNFTDVFNLTALTRRDADYVFRYGQVVSKEKPMKEKRFRQKLINIFAQKRSLVAARISNCEPLERLKYIWELRKYIPVDFYGSCGNKHCPKSDEECNGSKMAKYKFYLSFENSRCRDYITEKFWLPLHHWNSVPIVMGGFEPRDYFKVAPPNSFINVDDFSTPKELAQYLFLLDKNQTLYETFFQWRRFYGNRRHKDDIWCNMCADLHNLSKPSQYYTDFKRWYRQDVCATESRIYKNIF